MAGGVPEIFRGSLRLPVILSCDHASGCIPPEFGNLGLTAHQLEQCEDRLDKGAVEIFDYLCHRLDCFGVKACVSRLVIDVNRSPDHPQFIRQECPDHRIPGNHRLIPEEVKRRMEAYYQPYHQHLASLVAECERIHGTVFFLPIHTMADFYHGQKREIDIALIHTEDCAVADRLGRLLRKKGYMVTFNHPLALTPDLLKSMPCQLVQRFAKSSAIIEVNDRHQNNQQMKEDLYDAIVQAVKEMSAHTIPPAAPDHLMASKSDIGEVSREKGVTVS